MAVYTHIDEGQLEQFLQGYPLGKAVSFKGIAEGISNSNFLLETEKGRYILTIYERRIDTDDLPFFLNLMSHFSKKGISCPLPIKAKNGKRQNMLANKHAALFTLLEGISIYNPTAAHCHAIGELCANMHLNGQDFEMSRKNAFSLEAWQQIYEQTKTHAERLKKGLAADLAKECAFLQSQWQQKTKPLTKGIIHADLFPDNVFFLNNRLSGVIDFYFACSDILAYDVAVAINAWCFERDGSFNTTKAQKLMQGYQSLRKLSSAEMEALPLLARGAAMRFLLTRLQDWFAVESDALVQRKDPLQYWNRLSFHRKVTTIADYGISP